MCQANSNNDLTNIPAAACSRCGGWTGFGGMSQYSQTRLRVIGRTGCDEPNPNLNSRTIWSEADIAANHADRSSLDQLI